MVHLLASRAHGKRTLIFSAAILAASLARAEKSAPEVLVASYSGIITPVAAEYLGAAIERAERDRAAALVIELDTPGGLDLAMREIVKREMASTVPVVVYVAPAGARAASAGVFITMAAHVAAMAPGTNIGAAHPVQLGGRPSSGEKEKDKGEDDVMEKKIANDAAAYLQAIAAKRGRNAAWAAQSVTESVSLPAEQALKENIVDLEADGLEALLRAIDGKVLPDFKNAPLRTADARVVHWELSRRQRLLAAISDPNVAMVLMTLGVSGLLIELYSPGLILPGIAGALSLVLAFYSFQQLSANLAGVLLMLLGTLLFIVELKVVTHGLLAVSGTIVIFLGALLLFKGAAGGVGVSWSVLASTCGTLIALLAVLLFIAKRALGRKARIGVESIRGQKAQAVTALVPAGEVLWRGERWRAECHGGHAARGDEVVIESVDGLTLRVRRKD